MPFSVRKNRVLSGVVLAVILACGFVVRARGLDQLLPLVMNRDGLVHLRQTEYFQGYRGDPEGKRMLTINPHLLSRLAALWPPLPPPQPPRSISLDQALELSRWTWVHLRTVSLILSPFTLLLSYLLARRFLDRPSSLFATGLVATCFLQILPSAQEKAHSAVTTFLLLTLLAAMRLRRKPDVGSYLLFGAGAALTMGTLHHGLMCIPVFAVAWLLREKQPRRASFAWILAPLAMFAAALWIWCPFVFERGFGQEHSGEGRRSPTQMFLRILRADEYQLDRIVFLVREVWEHDPVLVTVSALGAFLLLASIVRDRGRLRGAFRGDTAILLAYTLPYSFAFCFIKSTNARYTAELVPVLAILGGYAFSRGPVRWFSRAGSPLLQGAGLLAVGGAVLLLPYVPAWRLASIRSRADTLEECALWIDRNLRPESRIITIPVLDLPLLPTDEALAENTSFLWKSAWANFLSRGHLASVDAPRYGVFVFPGDRPTTRGELLDDPAPYFRRWNAEYVVLMTPADPLYQSVRGWLRQHAEFLARFSPLRAEADHRNEHIVFQNDPSDADVWALLDCRAIGPTVEIYKLP
jgi:hypothetical protein